MLSATGSMQVTRQTLCMREECVPGTPSEFLSAWERGYTVKTFGLLQPSFGCLSCMPVVNVI